MTASAATFRVQRRATTLTALGVIIAMTTVDTAGLRRSSASAIVTTTPTSVAVGAALTRCCDLVSLAGPNIVDSLTSTISISGRTALSYPKQGSLYCHRCILC